MDIVDNLKVLRDGELRVTGRLVDASNATLYATSSINEKELICIYKPIAGERPLWDFPDGTLADREYAAYLVSEYLDFHLVPQTVLRDGPYGKGMVQEWINLDENIDLTTFFSTDNPELRKMALFDAIINNTDRKIGHLLPVSEEIVLGCDHGVTFHQKDKLRTVLWQWADKEFSKEELSLLNNALHQLEGELGEVLQSHLTAAEIRATKSRVGKLLSTERFPLPNPEWPAVPWPAF